VVLRTLEGILDVASRSGFYEFHSCTLCREVPHRELFSTILSLLLALEIALYQSLPKIHAETYNTDLTNQNNFEELNKHFSKIGKNISSKIEPPPATFNDFLTESFPNLCTFPPTSADGIRQIIASLKC